MLEAVPRPAPTRERILDAARQLAMERGFGATTVDAVLEAAEASKGAFFHHFPSKAALGRALIERYADDDVGVLDALVASVEAETDDPVGQLMALLDGFEQGADGLMEVQPSCLFISFIYENELADAGTDAIVADAVLHWRNALLAKLEAAARAQPELADLDLDALADHVWVTYEGAFLLARATGDPSVMRRQLAQVRRYVELLFEPAGAPAG